VRVIENNWPIDRPKILIVTPHPVIGAGIETVLRLEDLYDLRRAANLADAKAAAELWPADAALVDGVLVGSGALDLDVPCTILSGDAASGQRLAEMSGARGWLQKDAPPARLVEAIDRSLGIIRVHGDVRGTLGMIVAAIIVLVFLAALSLFVWRFVLS
jgi:DNA-binding NarL/FixJ family response regulator